MNEILGPIYYTFVTDSKDAEHAEADAFFCFTGLQNTDIVVFVGFIIIVN